MFMKRLKNLIFYGFLAVIVGVLFWFGILDREKAESNVRSVVNTAKGAANTALRTAESAVDPAETGPTPQCISSCRQTLKEIETAKRRIRERSHSAVGSASKAEIEEVLGHKVSCGCGATIEVGSFEQEPRAIYPNGKVIYISKQPVTQGY